MSGFASSIILSGKVFAPPEVQPVEQEAAGKVGKIFGAIAAVVIPFAAPAIWGAIAGSTAIGASLAGAMTSTFGATLTNIIGNAVIGGALNAIAGGSFAQGALSAGLRAGVGSLSRAASGVNAVGGTGPVSLAPPASVAASSSIGSVAAGLVDPATQGGGGIMSQIANIFSGGGINRIGAAIANAVVNGESQERLDALMAEQRAALAGLNAQEQAAYAQRMAAAEQVLAAAGRMDPARAAYMRMGDVAAIMNREHDQAKRNIAVKQGGSLDAGQRKAYERSGRLEIGRRKAQAWGEGYDRANTAQAQLYGQAAGLFTGPNFGAFDRGYELEADAARTRNQLDRSTMGGFVSAFQPNYNPSTSPSPSDPRNQNDDDDNNGNNDAFTNGYNWFGG